MTRLATAREALLVEALEDMADLIGRVEALGPHLDASCAAMTQASADLAGRLASVENRTVELAAKLELKTVAHVVKRTNEITQRAMDAQTRAMAEAARKLFESEAAGTLGRIDRAAQAAARRGRSWTPWITHISTALAASALTLCTVAWLAPR